MCEFSLSYFFFRSLGGSAIAVLVGEKIGFGFPSRRAALVGLLVQSPYSTQLATRTRRDGYCCTVYDEAHLDGSVPL